MAGGVTRLAILLTPDMGQAAGKGVDALAQRAAERDVQFLNAAANGKKRQADGERLARKGERGGIARRIVGLGGQILGGAVTPGFDIARAAIEQHAIESREQIQGGLANRWDQHRDTTGNLEQRRAIARRRAVMHLALTGNRTRGNADDNGHVVFLFLAKVS
jgi:hypothetical protein